MKKKKKWQTVIFVLKNSLLNEVSVTKGCNFV